MCFFQRLKLLILQIKDDLIYVDPPYLHSTAVYNDNNRNGLFWNEKRI